MFLLLFKYISTGSYKPRFTKECEDCMYVTGYTYENIINGLSDEEIKAKYMKNCTNLRVSVVVPYLRETCEENFRKYYQIIKPYILDGHAPRNVCSLAGYCIGREANHSPRKHRRNYKVWNRIPEANGPVFETETSPTWSQSWEEDI